MTLSLLLLLACGSPDTDSHDTPELDRWTVLVFMNGDNNLESYVHVDLNEIERARPGEGVNLLVQADRSTGYATNGGDWTGGRRYRIVPVIDLGSGWGTLVGVLSAALPGPVLGYDLSPLPWAVSRLRRGGVVGEPVRGGPVPGGGGGLLPVAGTHQPLSGSAGEQLQAERPADGRAPVRRHGAACPRTRPGRALGHS